MFISYTRVIKQNKMESKKDRRLDISAKLIEMGQSLMTEGKESDDYSISQVGSFMVLIGGLLFNEKDIYVFGELCSMYSSKKVLESLETLIPNLSNFILEKGEYESYDDLIKKINKLRDLDGESED
jgi:hypothetical protein